MAVCPALRRPTLAAFCVGLWAPLTLHSPVPPPPPTPCPRSATLEIIIIALISVELALGLLQIAGMVQVH